MKTRSDIGKMKKWTRNVTLGACLTQPFQGTKYMQSNQSPAGRFNSTASSSISSSVVSSPRLSIRLSSLISAWGLSISSLCCNRPDFSFSSTIALSSSPEIPEILSEIRGIDNDFEVTVDDDKEGPEGGVDIDLRAESIRSRVRSARDVTSFEVKPSVEMGGRTA